jgi:hypothetical protein
MLLTEIIKLKADKSALGTAAYEDKVTSSTDTTSGRVLTTGYSVTSLAGAGNAASKTLVSTSTDTTSGRVLTTGYSVTALANAGTAATRDVGIDDDEIVSNSVLVNSYNVNARSPVKPTILVDFGANEFEHYDGFENSFTPKVLGDWMTFERNSIATGINAVGKIYQVAANEPRVTHSNGVPLGLLIEKEKTNLLLHSQDFSQPEWLKGNNIAVTEPGIPSIVDGGTLYEITDVSNMDGHIRQVITIPNNLEYFTQWWVVKKGTSDDVGMRLALGGGVAVFGTVTYTFSTGNVTATGPLSGGAEDMGNGFVLVWCRAKNNATGNVTADVRYYPRNPNIATQLGSTYVALTQLEMGVSHSSYIPTSATSVTRVSDIAFIDFDGDFNQSEYSVVADLTTSKIKNESSVIFGVGNTFSDTTHLLYSGVSCIKGGVSFSYIPLDVQASTRYKVGISVKENLGELSINGGDITSKDWSPQGNLVRLSFGKASWTSGNHNIANITIRRVAVYPKALPSASLTNLTVL